MVGFSERCSLCSLQTSVHLGDRPLMPRRAQLYCTPATRPTMALPPPTSVRSGRIHHTAERLDFGPFSSFATLKCASSDALHNGDPGS